MCGSDLAGLQALPKRVSKATLVSKFEPGSFEDIRKQPSFDWTPCLLPFLFLSLHGYVIRVLCIGRCGNWENVGPLFVFCDWLTCLVTPLVLFEHHSPSGKSYKTDFWCFMMHF